MSATKQSLLRLRFELSKDFDEERIPEKQRDIAKMLKAIDIELEAMDANNPHFPRTTCISR